MSPKVYKAFASILSKFYKDREKPRSVLEIGASSKTLLSIAYFDNARKVVLNSAEFNSISNELRPCELKVGNSNEMTFFKDSMFDCILSCSVFEHDKYFWKSLMEINRVISPGGIFIVGVPIYMKLPTDYKNTTLTYERHGYSYNADFYRFSEQTVREVIFESFESYESNLVRRYPNPYFVMSGIKRGK